MSKHQIAHLTYVQFTVKKNTTIIYLDIPSLNIYKIEIKVYIHTMVCTLYTYSVDRSFTHNIPKLETIQISTNN